jgi:HEPN superfamily RiboL-PSP-like protein
LFDLIRAEINARILVAKQLAALIRASEVARSLEAAVLKGLIFVHLYGIYENAIHSAVRAVLASVRSDQMSPRDLHYKILTLVLHREFASASDAGRLRMWKQRLDLVNSFDSATPLKSLDDTIFPSDGSHYRIAQLETIWTVFGIVVPVVPEPRYIGRIEELVENRNAIAHGRRTPEEVGGRYSVSDIEKRVIDIEQIAIYIVMQMETHYDSGGVRR